MVSVKSLALGLLAAVGTEAYPKANWGSTLTSNHVAERWCAQPAPGAALVASHKHIQQQERNAAIHKVSLPSANATINLPVYFHVAASANKSDDIPNDVMHKQFDVLAASYKPFGVNMKLRGISRVYDNDLATGLMGPDGDRTPEQQAKFDKFTRKYRKGGYATLNVYFYTNFAPGSGLLGVCYFPEANVTKGDATFWQDGCQINGKSVPGGSAKNYDLGLTAVHEVGHWFGLFHVFQDDQDQPKCTIDNDFVDDTPIQSTFTRGCPASQDSCPDQPGSDSIHNYMDYSYDLCYTEFTAGQQTRLHAQYQQFRNKKALNGY